MFTDKGVYPELNWFFLIGLLAPVPVWLLSKQFPNQRWIELINMPIILGATGSMPPARAVNYLTWLSSTFMCIERTRAGGLGTTIFSLLLWMLAWPSRQFCYISPSNPRISWVQTGS
ncbi:unnamed protein product [Prunus brigantina]